MQKKRYGILVISPFLTEPLPGRSKPSCPEHKDQKPVVSINTGT
jgi:hypothetical protein